SRSLHVALPISLPRELRFHIPPFEVGCRAVAAIDDAALADLGEADGVLADKRQEHDAERAAAGSKFRKVVRIVRSAAIGPQPGPHGAPALVLALAHWTDVTSGVGQFCPNASLISSSAASAMALSRASP